MRKKQADKINRKSSFAVAAAAIALFAAIAPGSAAVLCIGPGGHIEIEDVNSGCCARSLILFSHDHSQTMDAPAGHCGDCRDFLIATNGRAVAAKSCTPPAEWQDSCYSDGALDFICRSQAGISNLHSLHPSRSPSPLRC
jgi:hypothetical protein